MKTRSTVHKLFFIPLVCLVLASCKKDSEPTPAAVVKFLETSQAGSENITSRSGIITIDRVLTTDLEVTVTTSGTATKDWDFKVSTETVTIPAGQTTVNYDFTVKNDSLVETANETVIFEITAVNSTSAKLSTNASDLTYTYTISDNDIPAAPASGLRIDLTWDAFPKTATTDLDLYLYREGSTSAVNLSDNGIGSFDGIVLANTDADGTYIVEALYFSGNSAVEFSISTVNAANQATSFHSTFTAAQGSASPRVSKRLVKIIKTGSTYTMSQLATAGRISYVNTGNK